MVQSELVITEDAGQVVIPMTADEARQSIYVFKNFRKGMYLTALELYDRDGWKALGYRSWYECAKEELEVGSEDAADRLINAGRVQRNIFGSEVTASSRLLNDAKFSTSALLHLRRLPVEQQREAALQAIETAPNGSVTAAHVERVVDEYKPRAIPVAPLVVSDKEVISVIKNGAQQVIDHAKQQWIGNVYQTDEETRRENLDRWREIEHKVADVVSPAKLAPLMSSATPEWYTPQHIVDRVIRVFGQIDLDPCSNSKTEPNVPAKHHFTQEDDGMSGDRRWNVNGYIEPGTPRTRVYMNPPYGDAIGAWVERLVQAYEDREIAAAIALLPARTDTAWFQPLFDYPRCFVRGRLKFSGAENSAPFPSVVVYLGIDVDVFQDAFDSLGPICIRRKREANA